VITDLTVIPLLQLCLWNLASLLEHSYWYICLVLEVPGLNFGQDLHYTCTGFYGFFSLSRQFTGQCFKLGSDCFLPHPFRFIIHYPSCCWH